MPLYPACEFPLLSDFETIEEVIAAVSNRKPFSLIRLGDGEAVVLTFGDDIQLQDLAYLHGHWGTEGVTLGAIAEVSDDLREAVRGADIVGVRDDILGATLPADLLAKTGNEIKDVVSTEFRIRQEEVERLSGMGARRLALLHRVLSEIEWSEEQRFCSAWIHWELLASGALNTILEQVPEVGLVTSRPEIGELISRRFGVRTSTVLTPDKFVEVPESGRHVPERYRTIRTELAFPEGTLVLVGAGIPGKVYCQWLKESGCVAIDVGSVFDAWVGKASRPRVLESRFGVSGGDLVPRELQLGPLVSPESQRLIPKWKPTRVSS